MSKVEILIIIALIISGFILKAGLHLYQIRKWGKENQKRIKKLKKKWKFLKKKNKLKKLK